MIFIRHPSLRFCKVSEFQYYMRFLHIVNPSFIRHLSITFPSLIRHSALIFDE